MKKVNFYYGWKITYHPEGPVTGKFRAVKHGVSMCANTQAMLVEMIDKRRKEVDIVVK